MYWLSHRLSQPLALLPNNLISLRGGEVVVTGILGTVVIGGGRTCARIPAAVIYKNPGNQCIAI